MKPHLNDWRQFWPFSALFVFVCDSSCVQCHALIGPCNNDFDSDSDSDSGTCTLLRLPVRATHNSKLECNVVALLLGHHGDYHGCRG